jgi:hypothetical protein
MAVVRKRRIPLPPFQIDFHECHLNIAVNMLLKKGWVTSLALSGISSCDAVPPSDFLCFGKFSARQQFF